MLPLSYSNGLSPHLSTSLKYRWQQRRRQLFYCCNSVYKFICYNVVHVVCIFLLTCLAIFAFNLSGQDVAQSDKVRNPLLENQWVFPNKNSSLPNSGRSTLLPAVSRVPLQPKISIVTTTAASLESLLPWVYYHKVIGISNFYMFVERDAAFRNSTAVLRNIHGVKVIIQDKKLEKKQNQSRIWHENWLSPFFNKPCSYKTFVKQNLNMERGIELARKAGMEWIMHLDSDELVYPAGSPDNSIMSILAQVPEDVDQVIWHNDEAVVERDNIVDPFIEITLFKKNLHSVPSEVQRRFHPVMSHNNKHYFLTYSNGKAAVRIQDDIRPNGPHRWSSYSKRLREHRLEESVILHYSYTMLSDLSSRKNRCKCKLDPENLKKCFMLQFDRDVFKMVSTTTEEEMRTWFQAHVVWSVREDVLNLLSYGVMHRTAHPKIIIHSLRQAGVFKDAMSKIS